MRIWKISALAIAAAGIAGYTYLRGVPDFLSDIVSKPAGAAVETQAMPPMPVPVIKVVKKTLPVYLDYTARTEAVRAIAFQAKVAGYILSQSATDGADVKEGDLIYKIDPRDYQAARDGAVAQNQRDQAALDYAKSNLDRGADLNKTGFLSKDVYQQRVSAVAQGEAAVAIDKAAVEAAEINLGYTEIKAPFAGRLGRNQAPVGTLINPGSTALNTLVQIAPIYVTFSPTEGEIDQIRKARDAGTVTAEVTVPGDKAPPRKGELTFIDNRIDPTTGTIIARATLGNEDRSLLPGQYVNIRLLLGEEPNSLMVPQVALGSNQMGKYLYVVDAGNKVALKQVDLGQTDGELVAITKGIADGDQVINGNLQKIGPGMTVKPVPAS